MSISRRQFLGAAALIWQPGRTAIRWRGSDPDGSKYAVIDGDRDVPGQPFTYAFWMPKGLWVKPHTHNQQAHVAVVEGTLLLGFGSVLDRSATRAIPAGGYFIVRANDPHFEGCATDTLIIGTALGGWKTARLAAGAMLR